jgi:exodeoxyribonuclease-3
MLRIVTLNLNGIRSAARKGFVDWAAAQDADVICVQEVRASLEDIADEARAFGGLTGHFALAERRGYSGVGLYLRREPRALRAGFGCDEFDCEGRYLEADLGDVTVVSTYLPSGSSGEERQAAKFRFMARFGPRLAELRASGREVVVCGDLNIAHREADLRNWKSNQKNSGFLPEERAWLSTLLADDGGWVDVYRRLHPDATDDCYTWWSNRGQAWAKNVGWRLDYQIATPGLARRARRAAVCKEPRFSDHAPLTVDYDPAP